MQIKSYEKLFFISNGTKNIIMKHRGEAIEASVIGRKEKKSEMRKKCDCIEEDELFIWDNPIMIWFFCRYDVNKLYFLFYNFKLD